MKDNRTFDEILSSKLSSIQPEYKLEYWEKYLSSHGKRKRRLGFVLPWFAYVLGALLFVLGWFLRDVTFKYNSNSNRFANEDTVHAGNDRLSVDTVIVRDTVYILDPALVLGDNSRVESTASIEYAAQAGHGKAFGEMLSDYSSKKSIASNEFLNGVNIGNEKYRDIIFSSNSDERKSISNEHISSTSVAADGYELMGDSTKQSSNEIATLYDQDLKEVDNHMKLKEDELIEIAEDSIARKRRMFAGIGCGINGFGHVNRNYIESSLGGFTGLDAYWKLHRFGIGIGLYYGAFRYEIDDVELTPSETLLGFVDSSINPSNIDDINVRTTNVLVPFSAFYDVVDWKKFRANVNIGALYNVVMREKFQYVLNVPEDEELEITSNRRYQSWSHASLGVGLGYALNNKWRSHLGITYYIPLSNVGQFAFSNPLLGCRLTILREF